MLGTLLRIDVSTLDTTGAYSIPPDNPFVGAADGSKEEIWAYGLRNPWKFSFDSLYGDLWAADVGQNKYEEINLIQSGGNYGWDTMEGFHCFEPSTGCDQTGLELPVFEYNNAGDDCSVTGGHLYRGRPTRACTARMSTPTTVPGASGRCAIRETPLSIKHY